MSTIKTAVAGMITACSAALWGCSGDKAPAEQEVPVVMVAQPGAAQPEQHSYAGDVQAQEQTALAFRVAGQVAERYADVGDQVRAGQVLARLDAKDAQLQLNAAGAQLESAQAAARIAEDELKRFQQLLPVNAVSRSQYDTVDNQHKAALSSLKQAQSNYQASSNQTQYNQLTASKSGVITARNIEAGQVIAAGQAAYQLAIGGGREVVIGVPEQAVAAIKAGQPAQVMLWSKPEEKLDAAVREISPAADQSRTYSVKVALRGGAADGIQLGQSARVFFSAAPRARLSVPLSSISADANDRQPYVFIVNADHTLRKVPVVLGAYGRDSAPVLSGLNPADYVVVGGVHLLRAKQKVNPVDRDNRAVKIQAGG